MPLAKIHVLGEETGTAEGLERRRGLSSPDLSG